MKLDMARVVLDAWALFRRDRDLLLRVAGLFIFLPSYAIALLLPEPPLPRDANGDEAAALAWADAVSAWGASYGGWYCLAYAVGFFGAAVIAALYLVRPQPDLRGALGTAARVLPRFLLAMLLVSLGSGAGLLLWVIPGLYILGRLMLTAPVLLAERPVGAGAAIARSVRLTRGQGLVMMGLAAVTVLTGWLLAEPFLLVDGWMKASGAVNPVVLAIVDAGAAAAATATVLAQALFAIVAYRRLASRGI